MSQARIKKIMQADEEVGKIAMATPVLICRFLWAFNSVCVRGVGGLQTVVDVET